MELHPAILSDEPRNAESQDKAMILRLMQQVKALEDTLVHLGSVDNLLNRIKTMEESLYSNKEILSLEEACTFLGASKSQLYKLTRTLAIPHYKPGGKAIYFYKSEVVEWVRQYPIAKVDGSSTEISLQEENGH